MCVSLLSDTSGAGSGEVTMIVLVNQMLLMIAGDVEPNPGPGMFICYFYEMYMKLLSCYYSDTLTMEDLKTLVNELFEVRDKWYHLGVQLNMRPSDLKAIRTQYHNDPDDCLLEMLSQWLSITTPPPTWQTVVDALYCPAILKPLLAETISEKFCNQNTGNNEILIVYCLKYSIFYIALIQRH